MSTWERLRARLSDELGIECDEYQRTYAGWRQKSEGAWAWTARCKGRWNVGSQWTMSELVRAPSLSVARSSGDFHIIPE